MQATLGHLTDWIGRFDKPCRWPQPVKRSLITLKALVDRKTGGLVAAATLGLPEVPQGSMNWDYRYCWLRDATFTLSAMLNAGYREEAERWRDWILRAVAGRPDKPQIVYRADGGRRLAAYDADWLPGYKGRAAREDRQRRLRPDPARRVRRADGQLPRRRQGRDRPAAAGARGRDGAGGASGRRLGQTRL